MSNLTECLVVADRQRLSHLLEPLRETLQIVGHHATQALGRHHLTQLLYRVSGEQRLVDPEPILEHRGNDGGCRFDSAA